MADENKPLANSLASLIGSAVAPRAGATERIRAMATEAGHDRFLKVAASFVASAPSQGVARSVVPQVWARGDRAWDLNTGRKVTVVRVGVARTRKGTPIHKVTARDGETWLVSEKKLRRT